MGGHCRRYSRDQLGLPIEYDVQIRSPRRALGCFHEPAKGELDHVYPDALPHGRSVLFTITTRVAAVDAPAAPRRMGFLTREISVPRDFDRMGEAEIAARFGVDG